jgi:hydrogenase maturation protease
MKRILVAGIGNELFGDDGFGVAVVQRLQDQPHTQHPGTQLTLMNAGTRGFDLVTALSDGYDAAILIDAVSRGRAPGTVYVLDPTPAEGSVGSELDTWLDPHRLEPARALLLARATGACLSRVFVVGCEPAPQLEMSDQLSPAVAAAIAPAIAEIERLIASLALPPEAVHA